MWRPAERLVWAKGTVNIRTGMNPCALGRQGNCSTIGRKGQIINGHTGQNVKDIEGLEIGE